MMKWQDPTIQTVLCGSSSDKMPTYPDWDRTALEIAWEHFVPAGNANQLLCTFERKVAQDHAVHDAEHQRGQTDAQRQRQNCARA